MPKPIRKRKRPEPAPLIDDTEAPPELELDPSTGGLVGRKQTSRVLWSRQNKSEAEERFQFYSPVTLGRAIRNYVHSTPELTYSKFFILAARAYLASKGR